MVVAYPCESVVVVDRDKVPEDGGKIVKFIVSLGSGFPFTVRRAVIVEVIVEPAATVIGFAETAKVPEEIVIVVVWVEVPHMAVTFVVPVFVPGVKVIVAYP